MAYTDDFFDDGEHEYEQRVYLNLRGGYVAQTQSIGADLNSPDQPDMRAVQKWEAEGWRLDHNENKAGTISWFMAKRRNPIQGYVTSIKWYSNELKDRGVTLTGWKLVIETPKQAYQLQIGSNDRAFSAFMNSFLNCDFNRTVKFNGYKKDGKKNLLLYQGDNNGRDFVQGKLPLCYQEPLLQDKVAQGLPLTEEERRNVVFDEDGRPKQSYPYVIRSFDGKWDFSAWNRALKSSIERFAIPAIEEANAKRDPDWKGTTEEAPVVGHGDVELTEPDFDPDADAERAAIASESPLSPPQRAATAGAGTTGADVAAVPDDDIPW